MTDSEKLYSRVPSEYSGRRVDQVLADLFPDFSRSRLQKWVREGHVRLNDALPECSDKVEGGARIELEVPQNEELLWQPQPIPLDVLYEDDTLIVVNKPPGMVVHPGAGNAEGTLLNALLHHDSRLESVPRGGIVHRLDKDTSGLLVVAKSDAIRLRLIRALQARRVKREYLALVNGQVKAGGVIEAPIGRHPVHRTRMAVRPHGKPAVSRYFVKKVFRAHSLLQITLESGRTHQIRVHMAHLGYPVFGDSLYGGKPRIPSNTPEPVRSILQNFQRQALHAVKLGLLHPLTQEHMEWTAPLPADMKELLKAIRGVS